MYMVPCVYLC